VSFVRLQSPLPTHPSLLEDLCLLSIQSVATKTLQGKTKLAAWGHF
jgi:hypothetical protein